jgi:Skp family chaperone for outer membrane proteins
MNKFAFGAAFAALALGIPAAAPAQKANKDAAPSILIVDAERIFDECTACRAAAAQITTQIQQAQQLASTLRQPLQTEGQAIETALRALNGRQPDAALQTRIQTFQGRENSANQQLSQREQSIRSTQAHVNQQIGARLGPIVEQIRATRRAAIVLAKQSTMANDPALEITTEVLAQLNQQLPSVAVTPLPQQQAPAQPQPQGR